jgi:hypothetical protein
MAINREQEARIHRQGRSMRLEIENGTFRVLAEREETHLTIHPRRSAQRGSTTARLDAPGLPALELVIEDSRDVAAAKPWVWRGQHEKAFVITDKVLERIDQTLAALVNLDELHRAWALHFAARFPQVAHATGVLAGGGVKG